MCVCMYVCMYVCTYVCNTYVAFLCVGIPEGGLCMYHQGLWLCCPEIYVCTYVCTKGVYVHMCVCIYVSKSNEGSQLIYIQPWTQGCREGGWPLRGVRGCRHRALLDALCTYMCMYVHMNVPKLEMVSSSSAPYITFIYLCMYVCVHAGTPEGALCTYICTPEDSGSALHP